MAVELAKLSLWLHTFTVGAPLSFLDHHLRCGDSLFGEFVGPVEQDLRARFGLAMSQAVVRARKSAAGMAKIEALTDADIGRGASQRRGVSRASRRRRAELRAFPRPLPAARWLPAAERRRDGRGGAVRRRVWRSGRRSRLGRRCAPPRGGCAVHRGAGRRRFPPQRSSRCGRRSSDQARGARRTSGGSCTGRRRFPACGRSGSQRPARRLRRGDRQSALGPDEDAGGGVVRRPRARHRAARSAASASA